jgi:putative toxin-antitoxin system antitoxin component (TIGR02293 family)
MALIGEILGGADVFDGDSLAAIERSVRRGLPYASLEHVTRGIGLSRDEVARLLAIPSRTLTRRRQTKTLDIVESDRLYRLAAVLARGSDVLGSMRNLLQWLRLPNPALGGEPPLAHLDTEAGSREVETLLGRIEYGVFS